MNLLLKIIVNSWKIQLLLQKDGVNLVSEEQLLEECASSGSEEFVQRLWEKTTMKDLE